MIEARDLVQRYGDLEVLRGVSLRVEPGAVVAIIGPSGGGKSTFLRCLNGLETFQGGEITVDGVRITAGTGDRARLEGFRQIRRRVGMVFQGFHLFPHRTVLGNVAEGPRHVLGLGRAEAEGRARALLDRVGLIDKCDARPRQLSGGQQQRVAIARALAMQPRAILFDEPTSALDPRMTADVLAILADLATEGLALVIVTHAMRFARQVATEVHVFGAGRVVESGPPDRVFGQPEHPATRALLAEVASP